MAASHPKGGARSTSRSRRERRTGSGGQSVPRGKRAVFQERFIGGAGTNPVAGSCDAAAEKFKRMSHTGRDGMTIGLVNYIGDMPMLRDEILPRMEGLGSRKPATDIN